MARLPWSATIIVADPDWRNARDVPVGDLAVGWRVNGPARLSVRLPAADAHLLGWTALLGRWVWVPLGWLGCWGGVIEDTPGDLTNHTVELAAVSMATLLSQRVTPRTYQQYSGSAGSLILRLITDTARERPLWLDRVVADEDGPAVSREWRGDNLGQAVGSLASGAGGAWDVTVDQDRQIEFAYQIAPADRRARIALIEGYNVVAGSIRPSISRIVNDILAIANDRDWQRAGGARVEHASSIRSYDRRQATRRYAGHTRRSSLETVARAELDQLALPTGAVSLEIPASDPVLQELREWQTVQLWSGTLNRRYDLTVEARAYEPARGVVTVVGTAVES